MDYFKKKILLLFFALGCLSAFGQNATSDFLQAPKTKRFISAIEFFAGPSLSFNYGNKFIENYEDENVTNKRLLKVGYSFGLGVYHPIKDWLDINLRLAYEEKGTKSQMAVPELHINPEYTYKYLTIYLAPTIYFGINNKFSLSLGGYYSKIQSAKGDVIVLDTKNNITYVEMFHGREIRELRSDGSTSSIEFIPGLESFKKYDYGLTMSLGYLMKINQKSSITLQFTDDFGLVNINKTVFILANPPEKSHSLALTIGYILKKIN